MGIRGRVRVRVRVRGRGRGRGRVVIWGQGQPTCAARVSTRRLRPGIEPLSETSSWASRRHMSTLRASEAIEADSRSSRAWHAPG